MSCIVQRKFTTTLQTKDLEQQLITKCVRESQPSTRNHLNNDLHKNILKMLLKEKGLKKPLARLGIFNFLTRPTKYTCQLLFAKCNDDSETLRTALLASIERYKNHHSQCFFTARQKQAPNQEPSKIVITDVVAKQMHRTDIISSNV